MASVSKRQTTFAKLQREQAVREKHARKQSERLARKQQKRDAKLGLETAQDEGAADAPPSAGTDGVESAVAADAPADATQ
jgi:hypothetical protein